MLHPNGGFAERCVAGARVKSADMGLVWLASSAILVSSYRSAVFLGTVACITFAPDM
jgi:hypothetical protein